MHTSQSCQNTSRIYLSLGTLKVTSVEIVNGTDTAFDGFEDEAHVGKQEEKLTDDEEQALKRIRQYDPNRPLICFDERPCQLTDDVLTPLEANPSGKILSINAKESLRKELEKLKELPMIC